MSKYTTEVRYICEMYAGLEESVGFDDIGRVITDSRDKIFDFEYPVNSSILGNLDVNSCSYERLYFLFPEHSGHPECRCTLLYILAI